MIQGSRHKQGIEFLVWSLINRVGKSQILVINFGKRAHTLTNFFFPGVLPTLRASYLEFDFEKIYRYRYLSTFFLVCILYLLLEPSFKYTNMRIQYTDISKLHNLKFVISSFFFEKLYWFVFFLSVNLSFSSEIRIIMYREHATSVEMKNSHPVIDTE